MIGAGIPVAVASVYLLVRRDAPRMRLFFLHRAVLCFVLPLLLWFGALALYGGRDVIREVLQQSLFRFMSPSADHNHPIYFYCLSILGQLAPWYCLGIPLLWLRFGPVKRQLFKLDRKVVFPLVWFCTVFFALSVASAKRHIYLGPIYPPFAILAAMAWERLRQAMRLPLGVEAGFPAFALIVFAVLQIFVMQPDIPENSNRAIFKKAESVGAPLFLYQPNESIRGAAVFYLGRTVPVLRSKDFLSLLDDKEAKVVLAFLQGEPPVGLGLLEQEKRVQTLLRKDGHGRKEYRLYSILPCAS